MWGLTTYAGDAHGEWQLLGRNLGSGQKSRLRLGWILWALPGWLSWFEQLGGQVMTLRERGGAAVGLGGEGLS